MRMTFTPCEGAVIRKLAIADAEAMRIAIQQESTRSDESRYDHRLHGLLLVAGGNGCQQLAELFGEDRRTVLRWVHRVESHGLEGLRESERPGAANDIGCKTVGGAWARFATHSIGV